MYVCVCNGVTDKQIIEAVDNGAVSLQDLREELKVATCCGRCANCAKKVLQEAHSRNHVYEVSVAMPAPAFA